MRAKSSAAPTRQASCAASDARLTAGGGCAMLPPNTAPMPPMRMAVNVAAPNPAMRAATEVHGGHGGGCDARVAPSGASGRSGGEGWGGAGRLVIRRRG